MGRQHWHELLTKTGFCERGKNVKKSVLYGTLAAGLSIGLFFVGCSLSPSFYRVTDLQSGREYYAQEVDHLASGAVVIKDTRTDSVITLQNSQVKKINKDEYTAGLAIPASQPSAPAPAPTAAPAPSGTN
jgi:hypothetical protein